MSLLTFQDALERLQQFTAGTSMSRALGDMKLAVESALHHVYAERSWTYFESSFSFSSRATMTTGTVAYSHGGLLLAITGNTWPAWADRGTVVANQLYGDIDRATTYNAYVDPNYNFGQNIDAGSTFTLFQDKFTLPDLFQNVSLTVSGGDGINLPYMSPDEYMYLRSWGQEAGLPTRFTILSDPDIIGRYAIALYPSPDQVTTYYVKYRRAYREIRLSGDEASSKAGTVAIAAGGKIVTGTGTAFNDANHKNAILRVGDATNYPTGIRGASPWIEQFQLSHVANTGSATLRTPATRAFSGAKYVITDPIDLPPELKDAFLKRCRLELVLARPDTKKQDYSLVQKAYDDAIEAAAALDNKNGAPIAIGYQPGVYFPDRPIGEEQDG